mmetsp:Transcript_12387/g.23771  ORF Transcript_12387/g.23771 Transcript_12387/m.23771 type:complete len:449 (+) Transcript_12387:180-1526(+)
MTVRNEYEADKLSAIKAVQEDCHALALKAVQKDGNALYYASKTLREDFEIVIAAVQQNGHALKYAAERLKANTEIVVAATKSSENGEALFHAASKEVLMAAAKECGYNSAEKWNAFLKFVEEHVIDAEDMWKDMCEPMKADKEIKKSLLVAVQQRGRLPKHADESFWADKEIVLAAVKGSSRGQPFEWALDSLKEDKDFVMAVVKEKPEALKYAAKAGLSQDPDCLRDAGIWTPNGERLSRERPEKGIFSVKYSLAENCTDYATQVLMGAKAHVRLGKFDIYWPSAFCKESCDPHFTDLSWPCRGTAATCKIADPAVRTGRPTGDSCWRYSFRFHQQLCKDTAGFMVQVEECVYDQGDTLIRGWELGNGQQIETELAEEVRLKVFRMRQGTVHYNGRVLPRPFDSLDADRVADAIDRWYESRSDLTLEMVELQQKVDMSEMPQRRAAH